jgi:hypothetical protein
MKGKGREERKGKGRFKKGQIVALVLSCCIFIFANFDILTESDRFNIGAYEY